MIQSICIAIGILSPLVCCWCLWIGRLGGYEEGYSDGKLQAVRLAYMRLSFAKAYIRFSTGMEHDLAQAKIDVLRELIAEIKGGDNQHDESTADTQGTAERPDLRTTEQAEAGSVLVRTTRGEVSHDPRDAVRKGGFGRILRKGTA